MNNSMTGLLPVANRWSIVGLIVGPVLGISLCIANLSVAATGQAMFLAGPLHTLAASLVIMLTISSLATQLTARVIRNQHRILARLDEIGKVSDAYAAGYAAGLDAQPGASVSRLMRTPQ